MDLTTEFRTVLISVWLLLYIGNVNAQGSGGVAIGFGLGGDFMVDTPLGELPSPLVTLAAQGGQELQGQAAGTTGVLTGGLTDGLTGGLTAPSGPVQPTGGGFNVQGFSTSLGSNTNTLFPIDPSYIAGIANGQTIYLPGFLGSHLQTGSRVILPAGTDSPPPVDPNQPYVLQNEEFTALGNVGHLVRVPVPDTSSSIIEKSVNTSSSSSETSMTSSISLDGTIDIDPKDIIGVVDMNKVGQGGASNFFSFSPGTGHASEISALQSALQGTAVDMTDMIPPPFDTQNSFLNSLSGSNITIDTSSSSTSEVSSVDVITIENLSDQTNAATDTGGIDKALTLSNVMDGNSLIANDKFIMGASNTNQNMLDMNEQSMFDTGGLSKQSTNENAMFNTGSTSSSTKGSNEQLMMDTNIQSVFNSNRDIGGNIINNQGDAKTSEQSMFDTSATGTEKTGKTYMLNKGSASGTNVLDEQIMTNNFEQSMFNTGIAGGQSKGVRINNNEQSMFAVGSGERGTNRNEQTMLSTGSGFGSMRTNENSMFNTDGNMKVASTTQDVGPKNKKSHSKSAVNMGGISDNIGRFSSMQSGRTSLNQNTNTLNTNEASMFNSAIANDLVGQEKRTNSIFTRNNQLNTQSTANNIKKTADVTTDQAMQNNRHETSKVDEANMFNVESTMGVGTGLFDRPPIRGLFGVNTGGKQTIGVDGSRFGGINTSFDRNVKLKNGDTYKIKSNVLQSNNTGEFPSVETTIDLIQPGTSGTFNKLGSETSGAGKTAKDSVTSRFNSRNKVFTQTKDNLPKISDQNVAHVNNLYTADVTTDQAMQNNRHETSKVDEANMFNVESTMGVGNGLSGRPPIRGLSGVNTGGRQTIGIDGSRFGGINTSFDRNVKLKNGDTYKIKSNVLQSNNTGEFPSVETTIDLIQPGTSGTLNNLGSETSGAGKTAKESVTSRFNSRNKVFTQTDSLPKASDQNVPHVNDLNTDGVYPFEGSFSARDATLSEGSSAILDMSSVLQGHEPLHLEPSIDIIGTVVSGNSERSKNNTGIFAVARDTNASADITVDITRQGTEGTKSTDRQFIAVDAFHPIGNAPVKVNLPVSKNTFNGEAADISFVGLGDNMNTLVIDNVHDYLSKEQAQFGVNSGMTGKAITSNIDTSKMTNRQTLTQGDNSIPNASKLSLTSINDNRKGLKVAGNNNNIINKFNTLDTSRNVVNDQTTTITDGIDVAMSGFSGAPITNMVGVIPGKSSGGLAVSGINVPSFHSTSSSTTNDFSSSLSQEITSSIADNSGFPSGSFLIGAGQPNSKIISTGRTDSSNMASSVGGVAIGSEQSPGLASISLPARAFKTDERLSQDRLQTDTNTRNLVKVDMSNFIPPPFEEPKHTIGSRSRLTADKVGSTADLIKKALGRRNENDRFNNNLVTNQGLAFASQSNTNINQGISPDRNLGNQGISSGIGFSSTGTTSSDLQSQIMRKSGSTNDAKANTAMAGTISTTDRFNKKTDSNQNVPFGFRPSDNMNRHASTGVNRGQLAGTSSTNGWTASDQMSIMNERFSTASENKAFQGISAVDGVSSIGTSNNIEQKQNIPSVVEDHAIFTDLGRDANANPSINSVAAALDIHTHANRVLGNSAGRQSISKPIVGSIFGSGENSSSTLTQQFLEKSGITREPAVDFMTTFLQHAKPTKPPTGIRNNNVQIVPLSNFSPDNIIAGQQMDAQTVDQFGVADIYTRKQQLNPSQWQQLMSEVSHNTKTDQITVDLDYQTQNVIGASATKPLNGNFKQIPSSSFSSVPTRNSSPINTGISNRNSMFTRRDNDLRSSILFEAPGMTGHKSVTILNYKPRTLKQAARPIKVQPNIQSPTDIGQQSLREFVGSQATAERTSSFANTFKQNQQVGSSALPILPQRNGPSVNPFRNDIAADTQAQTGQLGETGQKIQNEMDTFKLGRSILISDGVIPEFVGPNSVHTLPIDARNLLVNGVRLGQPAIASQSGVAGSVNNVNSQSQLQAEAEMLAANEVTFQDIQMGANGAAQDTSRQSILNQGNRNFDTALSGGLNKDIPSAFSQNIGFGNNNIGSRHQNFGAIDSFGGLSQTQQDIGISANKDISINLANSNQKVGVAIRGDLDRGLTVTSEVTQNVDTNTGGQQSQVAIQNIGTPVNEQFLTDAGTTDKRTLDTAAILGLNAALKQQPMEPTLFTSGSRFAVFGRAGDVTGREFGNGHLAKPIPARRMGVLAPVHDCRYKPDPSSEYYFIYKNGITQHRFRCALGTAFDEMTCECSIRVSDHGDCLEVHMDFNNGIVEDSSLNRLPVGNDNVDITNSSSPLAGIALFGGDGKLTIWRYQNYDFRDHVMLKVQFRPGVGGDRLQPLITNCDSASTEPSLGIIYDNLMHEVILLLKTVNETLKELRFKVNPDEWNDVTYIYDGQEFIGIVNGVRRYVSRENPHLLGIIGGEIKSTPTQGLVEIRDAAIVLGHCPMYGFFRGAMVDIQVYTCIPKDFRLE